MAGTLILYYSRRGENYVDGQVQVLEKGNTETAAEYIRDATGGDLFRVETVKTYPADYYECIEVARAEQKAGTRPELVRCLDSLEGYDDIFVCGPIWWGTYPTAMFTQLERLDWKGKRVFPLTTHAGSGLANCQRDLKKTCKGAKVGKGLAVYGAQVSRSREQVEAWARKCVL